MPGAALGSAIDGAGVYTWALASVEVDPVEEVEGVVG